MHAPMVPAVARHLVARPVDVADQRRVVFRDLPHDEERGPDAVAASRSRIHRVETSRRSRQWALYSGEIVSPAAASMR